MVHFNLDFFLCLCVQEINGDYNFLKWSSSERGHCSWQPQNGLQWNVIKLCNLKLVLYVHLKMILPLTGSGCYSKCLTTLTRATPPGENLFVQPEAAARSFSKPPDSIERHNRNKIKPTSALVWLKYSLVHLIICETILTLHAVLLLSLALIQHTASLQHCRPNRHTTWENRVQV